MVGFEPRCRNRQIYQLTPIFVFDHFQLSSEVSGRDAETKVRGRLKEKESAEKEKRENEEKLRKELSEKFNKWNKG